MKIFIIFPAQLRPYLLQYSLHRIMEIYVCCFTFQGNRQKPGMRLSGGGGAEFHLFMYYVDWLNFSFGKKVLRWKMREFKSFSCLEVCARRCHLCVCLWGGYRQHRWVAPAVSLRDRSFYWIQQMSSVNPRFLLRRVSGLEWHNSVFGPQVVKVSPLTVNTMALPCMPSLGSVCPQPPQGLLRGWWLLPSWLGTIRQRRTPSTSFFLWMSAGQALTAGMIFYFNK